MAAYNLIHLQSYQEIDKGTKVRHDSEFEDSCTAILPAHYLGPLILWARISPAFGFTGHGLLIPSRRIVEEFDGLRDKHSYTIDSCHLHC